MSDQQMLVREAKPQADIAMCPPTPPFTLETHNVCDEHRNVATASVIEVWIDETERRTWFYRS